ncbi:MAG: hypothetical protein GY862_19075 [Gammaproteobacteria bacterium]|nr:hypothetical protein [Gammaproteobacteria bacterium]
MAIKHKPNHLHLLACYVLQRIQQKLEADDELKQQPNHPMFFEKILFIAGDAIRTTGHLDLGMQTMFQSPQETGGNWEILLETINTVLGQCVKEGWMEGLSSPDENLFNYKLLPEGEAIIRPILENKGYTIHYEDKKIIILKKPTLDMVNDIVAYWAGRAVAEFTEKLSEIAGDARVQEKPVPHYDFGEVLMLGDKDHKPDHLHLLACYTLFRMTRELKSCNKLEHPINNRMLFERILFITGDNIRTAGHLDMGLQTAFQSPLTTGGGWDVYLATVNTVLKQCVAEKWMEKPSLDAGTLNYRLLPKGEAILKPLLKNKGHTIQYGGMEIVILKKQTLKIVDETVKYWVGKAPEDIAQKLPEIVRNAHLEKTSVPHYDVLHDKWLKPFLDGVELSRQQ